MVPEGRGIFARLTVSENLDLGAYSRIDSKAHCDRSRACLQHVSSLEGAAKAGGWDSFRW